MNTDFATQTDDGFLLNPLVAAIVYKSAYKKKVSLISNDDNLSEECYGVCVDGPTYKEIYPYLIDLFNVHNTLYEIVSKVSNTPVVPSASGGFCLDHFDCSEYKILNPDLQSLSDDDAVSHYANHGKEEGRGKSFGSALFSRLIADNTNRSASEADIFNLVDLGSDFIGRVSLTRGSISKILEQSPLYDLNTKKESLLGSSIPSRSILFHVFYPDEIKHYIPVIAAAKKAGFGLFVSTPLDARPSGTLELAPYNPIFVKVPNIGRDILGFKASFDLARYLTNGVCSTFLVIHTKKSPHVHPSFRKAWVSSMTRWMHDEKNLDRFSQSLESNDLSMVASAECACYGYGDVPSSYFSDYPGSETLPYASGTMFLANLSILSKIFDSFSYDQFTEKPVLTFEQHLCGGIPHAAERLFSYEAQFQSGIAWV